MDKRYSIIVDDEQVSKGTVVELISEDIIEKSEGEYHIIINDKSYAASIVSLNPELKEIVIEIEGSEHTVRIQDDFDILVDQMGLNKIKATKVSQIVAPMPGLVLSIAVKEGAEIKAGEKLLILEAMKMENILKAPVDCVISSLLIKEGDAVEKNQILIELA